MTMKALERLKIRLLVWIMIALRLRPRALPGFDAVKFVQEERDDCMKFKPGDSIEVSPDKTVTVIRIENDAAKLLDMLKKEWRSVVLDDAVKLTLKTSHPYIVTVDDVFMALKSRVKAVEG